MALSLLSQSGPQREKPELVLPEASIRDVQPVFIQPGHPEQNGRHERFHSTLKRETATPPKATIRAQQRAFDAFQIIYNEERPHEALQMATPGSLYEPSPRRFPSRLLEMEYPAGFALRIVQQHGDVHWRFGCFFLGEALSGETVGFEDVEEGWLVWFGPLRLAYVDARQLHKAKLKSGGARGVRPRPGARRGS